MKAEHETARMTAEVERLQQQAQKNGVLAWFAQNHVAANLLMLALVVGGLFALAKIKIEVFPEVEMDMILVNVPYLGATPAEVERGVSTRIEEAIAGVEGIKKIRSISAEGMATVIAELEEYADSGKVMDDIKVEVDRIRGLPEETETPWYVEQSRRHQVITAVLYGNASERSLKELAENMRDELTALPNISQVDVGGTREYEISIEVSEENLRRYGLNFQQVSRAVAGSSLDLPAGSVKTQGGEVLVRTKGQRYRGTEFEDIVVMTRPDGTELYLSDVATVIDGFEDTDAASRFGGKPAVLLNVYRVGDQGALDLSKTVKDYVEEIRPRLPEGVQIATWNDMSDILRSRISLLLRNGAIGLALVFLSLLLFLDLRLAFWTSLGIPISFFGAFILLPQFGVSVNMMSLYAFIVVLGIVVDDAIVVGENIFTYRRMGFAPTTAAIMGVREMMMPVILAVLTTIAAFLPLMYTAGMMGKILKAMPLVVISVLAISLVEALLILPAHLSGKGGPDEKGWLATFQSWVRRGLTRFVEGPFAAVLACAVRWRYVTLAGGIAVLCVTLGYFQGGWLKWVFLPNVEGDNMVAFVEMPQGAVVHDTMAVLSRLEQAAEQVRHDYDEAHPENAESIFVHVASTVGQQPSKRGGPGGGAITVGGSHLGEVNVQLLQGEKRNVSAKELSNRWQELVGDISGVSSLTFQAELFTVGDAISVELAHRDFDKLLAASEELKGLLKEYVGVSEITDSFIEGKVELKLNLKPHGRVLGLTLAELARQVRQGFYGEEVQRIQRGRDDVRVMVRYPLDERASTGDIENMRIRLADGTEVPFNTVADVQAGRGYASINRTDRRRIVTVSADVDEKQANSQEINTELAATVLPMLKERYPGLTFDFGGVQEARAESMQSLMGNFIVALLIIYALLALQFRSYIQPIIVMSAIPFGFVGAVIGHVIMGFDLSFLSMFGLVALAGVVVNDSLIMIDLINRERSSGGELHEVLIHSATRRFRPIILTSVTTFAGLMPMIVEESVQAQFLIPMAVSLGFGVLFATVITLVMVPCLYQIVEDVKREMGAFLTWIFKGVQKQEDTGAAPVAVAATTEEPVPDKQP